MAPSLRRALLPLAFLLTTFALALGVSGGVVTSIAGVRVSARSPAPSALAAALLLIAWAIAAWRARTVSGDLAAIDAWIARRVRLLLVAIACAAMAVAILFNSFSAAGSDASGYLSQTAMLLEGHLTRVEPLAVTADWANADTTLAPLGWRPSPASEQVPTYAIGLPLLMLAPHAIGGSIAASLVVPIAFAIAILAIGRLALRIAGPHAAIVAAVGLATSPVALIESMQPMSDVPVTAAWLTVWALLLSEGPGLRRRFLAGSIAALAILIRPNLAPIAAVPLFWILIGPQDDDRSRRALLFSAPVAVAGAIVAYLQWRYFGSPLRSGYGSATEIYALANVMPNARLYTQWLVESRSAWLLAAPIALAWPVASRRVMRWLLAWAALIAFSYLLYSIFETWTYLRFLLPSIAMALIAVAVVVASAIGKIPLPLRVPVLAALVLALAGSHVHAASDLGVFRFAGQQRRALLAGRYLESAMPAQAVVLAGEQSGSIRYYTGRSIVRWDFLDPALLEQMARSLAADHDLWIALDVWEEELFRAKFRGAAFAALDWPPVVEAGVDARTRAWRLRDRAPFMRGDRVRIDRLR